MKVITKTLTKTNSSDEDDVSRCDCDSITDIPKLTFVAVIFVRRTSCVGKKKEHDENFKQRAPW
ncbi:hypothetical protein Bpfe_001666, partial [Biomphalaria pfeifferi]